MFKYTFFARVVPEYVGLALNLPGSFKLKNSDADLDLEVRVFAHNSQVTAIVYSEQEQVDIYTLRNQIKYLISVVIDTVGYLRGFAIDCEVLSVVLPDDSTWVFGVDEPGLKDKPHEHIFEAVQVINLALQDRDLHHALVNLRQAIAFPAETGFYCYRAIEAIRQHFEDLAPEEIQGPDKRKQFGWQGLKDTLNVDRTTIDRIAAYARPVRHGRTPWISGDSRLDAQIATRSIIDRFCIYLSNGQSLGDEFPQI